MSRFLHTSIGFATTAILATVASSAAAETYQVAPTGGYADIQTLMDSVTLMPGDVVEIEGDHTYPGDLWLREEAAGAAGMPITFKGMRKDGKRPTLTGVGTEEWHDMVLFLAGNHMVFEGFEVIGDGDESHTCVITQGDDIVLRDMYVHGCTGHGILATDWGTGDLTIEYSEFAGSGSGDYRHQIYVTTDQEMYPGSSVRIQFNYVHDSTGGLNIKSRAERTEIYFNWLENASLNTMDLIGPDANADSAREDSDVVGNVIVHSGPWAAARIGHDGTNGTDGRYRFAYNTFVFDDSEAVAIRPQVNIEALEIYNNAFVTLDGATPRLMHLTDYSGSDPIVMGSHNFIDAGFTQVPPELSDSLMGDPGLTDLEGMDLRPLDTSALVDTGTDATFGAGNAVPNPLTALDYVPPPRTPPTTDMPFDRNDDGMPDVGAYALGSGTEPGPGGPPPEGNGNGSGSGSGSGAGSGSGGNSGTASDEGGCATSGPSRGSSTSWLWLLAGAGLARRRSTRRRTRL
jgi:hypothetical protein